jgi:spore maturation protein SpmA
MLNRLWFGFFLVAAVAALSRWLIGGDETVFAAVVGSLFDMAELSVKVMLLLFGTLTLWLGFPRIAEAGGTGGSLARCSGRCSRG